MLESSYPTGLDLGSPNVHAVRDRDGNLTHIEHIREPVGLGRKLAGPPTSADLKELALGYIRSVASKEAYDITAYRIDLDSQATPDEPNEEESTLRLGAIKTLDEDSVFSVSQTFARLQVWQSGLSLSIIYLPFNGELVVTSSRSTLYLHKGLYTDPGLKVPSAHDPFHPEKITLEKLAEVFRVEPRFMTHISAKRLLVYRYSEKEREDRNPHLREGPLSMYLPPFLLDLQPVTNIMPGDHRAVTEVLFTTEMPEQDSTTYEKEASQGSRKLNWQAFIEVSSGQVLYLRAFVSGCFHAALADPTPLNQATAVGSVFCIDPVTATGSDPLELPPAQIASALDAMRVKVSLWDLERAHDHTVQRLVGARFVKVEGMSAAPYNQDPSVTRGGPADPPPDFTTGVMTNPVSFTAVSAYYNTAMMFRMMEILGFTDVRAGYFQSPNTLFPVSIDPQGMSSDVNAFVFGNGQHNGVERIAFGPLQSDNAAPGRLLGNATDVRVVLHEFCHTLLYAHLNSPNFGFAHSAGDSLAAILCDPGSVASGLERYKTFPWIAAANPQSQGDVRYHGGTVGARNDMSEWGWEGNKFFNDTTGYAREQILSMTLFRIYTALGGGSDTSRLPEKQTLASLYMAYLIIRAIALFPSNGFLDSDDPTVLSTSIQEADVRGDRLRGAPFSNIRGGAAHKVIRWGFEKQGLYQHSPVPPSPTERTAGPGEGAPPEVDLYINDKSYDGTDRLGEYLYTNDYTTGEIWNRTQPNPGTGPADHQPPVAGIPSFIFCRIRNRGYASASNAKVTAYLASSPSAGGSEPLWDGRWQQLGSNPAQTAGITVARGDLVTVGPFTWTPPGNGDKAYVLASVSSAKDPSNLEPNPLPLSRPWSDVPVPLWWLVPFDNNIGLRIMPVLSAGNGGTGFDHNNQPGGNTTMTGPGNNNNGGNGANGGGGEPTEAHVTAEEWIYQVVDQSTLPASTPVMPANTVILVGYLGEAQNFVTTDTDGNQTVDRTAHRALYRLYRTPQLNDYLEIWHKDIVHQAKVSESFSPYGGSVLWVKANAQIRYVYTQNLQAQASFLQGPLTGGNGASNAGPFAIGGPGQPGGGGGSFVCGGGGSFVCGGGGSFVCGGGGSFVCGGGGSFVCGGGGSFVCGGGGSFVNCS